MKFTATTLSVLSILSVTGAFTPSSSFSSSHNTLKVVSDPSTEEETFAPVAAGAIDKSLKGIDDSAEHDVFDPLSGDKPALIRNNNEEVWVPQVRMYCLIFQHVEKDLD